MRPLNSGTDFKQITRSRSFNQVIDDQDKLCEASMDLIKTIFPLGLGVRLIGVSISNFEKKAQNVLPQLGFDFS